MLDKIVDILKSFLENHFLPSLISIVVMSTIYYITPNGFSVLSKLGKNLYLLTTFCLILFIIEFAIIITKKINAKISYIRSKREYDNRILQENINELYDILDSLNPEELELVEYFVDNNNCCITSNMEYIHNQYNFNLLFDIREYKVKEDEIISVNPYQLDTTCIYNKGSYVNQFKLKEDIYKCLRNLKHMTGKISRF